MKTLTKDWGWLGMHGVVWLVLLTAMLNAQPPFYPSSRHGGNYMFNFYLPPPTSSTPLGAGLVSGRKVDRRRDERLHLESGRRHGSSLGADL